MIVADKHTEDESGRMDLAFLLLESSGYEEPWKSEIFDNIISGTPDDIELIIQDLYLNQVDNWNNYRQKDIQRRLDRIC